MLEGQMKRRVREEEEEERTGLDRSRGGNELEDTASLICFHLPLINWVKLARREKRRKGGRRKQ